MNNTKVSSRGQTVIPRLLRERYRIRKGSRMEWLPHDAEAMLVRKVSNKRPQTNWGAWARKLRGLGKEVWNDIDPVEYTHQSWHGTDR